MRLLRTVGIAVAVLAGVGLGAWLAGRGSTSSESKPTVPTPARPTVARPREALLVADRTRDVLVGLAARRGGPVDVIAIPSNFDNLPTSAVQATASGASPSATSCGPRCYRFPLRVLAGRPTRLTVTVRGRPVRFRLPATLPAVVPALYRAATSRMAGLRSVRVDEWLSSGRTSLRARFDLQAPDRLRYVTSRGQRAVVIGTTRWDRVGGRWRRSEYQRTRQPAYMWARARYPRLLGRTRVDERPVQVIAAFRPDDRYPAWFRLYVTRDRHIVRAEMMAPAHFMVDRLSDFDRLIRIEPPERSA